MVMYVGIDISVVLFPSYLQSRETLLPDTIMDHLKRSDPEVKQVPCGSCLPFQGRLYSHYRHVYTKIGCSLAKKVLAPLEKLLL
jgi:hypothetical protein